MPDEHEKPSVGLPAPQATILVVDDDGEILQLVARFLRSHGHRVLVARNGAEMWPILQQGSVDLIVLDLMLPGVSGLDICRELRRSSTVPVIMLTAKGDEVDRIVGLEVGAEKMSGTAPVAVSNEVKGVVQITAPDGSTAQAKF